jgi:hypothetical protein
MKGMSPALLAIAKDLHREKLKETLEAKLEQRRKCKLSY